MMRPSADARFFGQPLDEAARRSGVLAQLAHIEQLTMDDGPARGSRLVRLRSGGGLSADVHVDRALDIGQMEAFGVPLAWLSPTGFVAPGLCEARELRFLRSFGGGFLATCGLDSFGPPCDDDNERFSQHGRIGMLPARLEVCRVANGALELSGTVTQAAVHQEHLTLHRRITVPLGTTRIELRDTVTNASSHAQPHMIMYHCNFGWPLLDAHSKVSISHAKVTPLGDEAAGEPWDRLAPPTRGIAERCYLHTMQKGRGIVKLRNDTLGLTLAMDFDTTTLPGLCEWKMLGEQQYVLGLEPCNTLDLGGRAAARRSNQLKILEPGEQVEYAINFEVTQTA